MTPAKALQELRDYFEQKRNLALRESETAELGTSDEYKTEAQAEAYDHAMEMVATYIKEISDG